MRRTGLQFWQIGLILIGVATFCNVVLPAAANNQGEELGQGIVTLAAWILGITFIVVSIIQAIRNRRQKKSQSDSGLR
jgi:hypothetical protein